MDQWGGDPSTDFISQSVLRQVGSGSVCLCVLWGKSVHMQSHLTALRSDLYVHWPDFSSLILPHPQLSVFGWIHTLQELVHRLHRLDKQRTTIKYTLQYLFFASVQMIPHGIYKVSLWFHLLV